MSERSIGILTLPERHSLSTSAVSAARKGCTPAASLAFRYGTVSKPSYASRYQRRQLEGTGVRCRVIDSLIGPVKGERLNLPVVQVEQPAAHQPE